MYGLGSVESHTTGFPVKYQDGGGGGLSYTAPMSSGIPSPGDEQFASKMRARIAREMWEDYKQRFLPYVKTLTNQVGSKTLLANQLAANTGLVGQQYGVMAGEQGRHIARLGLNPSQAAIAQRTRANNLGLASARAAAANNTREAWRNRNLQIMGGSGSAIAQLMQS